MECNQMLSLSGSFAYRQKLNRFFCRQILAELSSLQVVPSPSYNRAQRNALSFFWPEKKNRSLQFKNSLNTNHPVHTTRFWWPVAVVGPINKLILYFNFLGCSKINSIISNRYAWN